MKVLDNENDASIGSNNAAAFDGVWFLCFFFAGIAVSAAIFAAGYYAGSKTSGAASIDDYREGAEEVEPAERDIGRLDNAREQI